jgi:hypothetical protein
MASHPNFDPNQLDNAWNELIEDPQAPLINRVTQGSYPTGDLAGLPFVQAAANPEVASLSLRLPLADTAFPEEATPLELAFAAAALSNAGVRPPARLALSYQHPEQEWQVFSPLGTAAKLLTPTEANNLETEYQSADLPIWQIRTIPAGEELTWYLAGTIANQDNPSTGSGQHAPLTLALVLEEENLPLAEEIGQALLTMAMSH